MRTGKKSSSKRAKNQPKTVSKTPANRAKLAGTQKSQIGSLKLSNFILSVVQLLGKPITFSLLISLKLMAKLPQISQILEQKVKLISKQVQPLILKKRTTKRLVKLKKSYTTKWVKQINKQHKLVGKQIRNFKRRYVNLKLYKKKYSQFSKRFKVGHASGVDFITLAKIKNRRQQLHLCLKALQRQAKHYVNIYTAKPRHDWSEVLKKLIEKIRVFLAPKTRLEKLGHYLIIWLRLLRQSVVKLVRKLAYSKPIQAIVTTYQRLDRFFNKPIKIHIPLRYFFALALIAVFVGGGVGFYYYILKDLPQVTELSTIKPDLTTKIYDRNGILLYKIYKNENRSLVPLAEIPNHVIQATIAIEDQNFYQHPGFSIRGISRAFRSNLQNESLQGGSTITQQLVKNTLLSPERTWERKVKEVVLSFIAEFYYSKDEILSMYLNQVPYGGSAYGVEEASQMYFGKSVRELDLAEAAFIAGLPASPTKYSPYGSNPEAAHVRQRQVIRRMVEDGYITNSMATEALSEEIAVVPLQSTILAPHFVMYVRDLLSEMYGSHMVENGGLEVTTSLDLALQNQAQTVVSNEINNLARLNVKNGAALITQPKTGEILAMVGSTNYFDSTNDGQVNVTTRLRQPGSSIKPLTYAMALERGLTPATVIPDTPVCFQSVGSPPYCPKNYDNRFRGRVTLRQSLAGSYNVPAVKTLAQFSVNDLIDKAEAMGISTWTERNRFGLALTLGGGEVKMTDMAVAYGVFANQGIKVPLQPILEVKTADGRVLAKKPCLDTKTNKVVECQSEQVVDPRVAYQITNILSDNDARAPAFGLNSVLHIPGQEVAVKTGTTNNLRDNWTIGYTSDFLVAVWVGNNDNTRMSYIASGITGASPIWNKLIVSMIDPQKQHLFTPPTNLAKVSICSITGTLACNGCPARDEYFIPGTEPSNHCSSEQIARILNPDSGE